MTPLLLVGTGLHSHSGYTLPARRILDDVLRERGLRAQDVEVVAPAHALAAMRRLKPNVVVALGDEAAHTLIPTYEGPSTQQRGYVFDGIQGTHILVTVSPTLVSTSWVPFRVLLSLDLQRARELNGARSFTRPVRNVEVVTSLPQARRAVKELAEASRLATDIEIHDENTLACIGFAPTTSRAIVFPAGFSEFAFDVLRNPVRKVAQNGQFDAHFLYTRCDVRIANLADDTLFAWHSMYPELAGASEDEIGRRRAKMTRKSLSFLASLYTLDAWWKDYEWEDISEFYELNGRDCCITLDIMEHLDKEIDRLQVREIYERAMRVLWPCVDMQARGLPVDDELRRERIQVLGERIESDTARLTELVVPLLQREWDSVPEESRHLFEWRRVCECCRNGKGKREACWACAGFEKKPGKRALGDTVLAPCARCEGAGEFRDITFNALSVDQKRVLLYDVLRLPKRYTTKKDKKTGAKTTGLSTDEDALKGLLAHVA